MLGQLPKILELVGLGYTGWFVYRYLLFKVINKHQPLLVQFCTTECTEKIEFGCIG